ncbi:energy transducer TonB [Desulfurobacterium atlanticum]|uniref:Outer membrane transport energization protein TonB n=1 Tax=Desulfurobacterium atlanticum TaxID=240169 RepID=A0A238YY19_9BACT|nr:energy transducer TonB [Desulfurobacterium atlanticum]SNR75651.1 outer membrane transport energization protein TonB [Desulfurobacterium atlanticum]
MSTFLQSKNRLLLFTLILSLLIHFLILKFIDANRNPAGKLITLNGDKTKIAVKIKQKAISNTEKQTDNKQGIEKKHQTKPIKKKSKVKKAKIKRKTSDKKDKNKTHQKPQKKTQISNVKKQIRKPEKETNHKEEKKEQKMEAINREKNNLSVESKKEENRKTTKGGSLFSFLNWKNMYIKEVINSLDKNKQYPELAKEMGIQGTVKLVLTIDRNGNVEKIEVAESSGFPILDKNAVKTVKKSKFPPFPPEVKKEKMKINIYITYKINGED